MIGYLLFILIGLFFWGAMCVIPWDENDFFNMFFGMTVLASFGVLFIVVGCLEIMMMVVK